MDGLIVLMILALIWLFLAPFFILGKISGTEERLKQSLEEMRQRLDALYAELRFSLPRPPDAETPSVISSETPESMDLSEVPLPSFEENLEIKEAPLEKAAEEIILLAEAPEEPQEAAWLAEDPGETETEPSFSYFAEEQPDAGFHEEQPREPGFFSKTMRRLLSWLLDEGNIWVCAGVLLFFVGFGLLFNYAIQFHRIRRFLTLEMRLAVAAFTGLLMAGFGFRMREKRRTYALILQGGGVGVLYLVVLAATKLNALSTGLPILSPTFAVLSMLMLSVFTVLLALMQNYQPLALFAILGGFVAPILVSTGSRNHVALFSIYSLLNLEILLIAFKRNWRLLNRMGFILSVAIGTAWGMRDWSPDLFRTVEPFLLIFWTTYTAISLLVARKRQDETWDPDLLLAVSVPFSFFFLQIQVVGHLEYGMALTCLGLGLSYLLLAAWTLRRQTVFPRILSRLFAALCLLFSNLVVPYAFESVASSAIWALEGAFLIFAACRYGSYKALIGGIVLHLGALVLYGPELSRLDLNTAARLSPIFISGTLFALSHWFSGFWSTRFRPSSEGPLYDDWERGLQGFLSFDGAPVRTVLSWIFTVLGSLWWWNMLYDQIPRLGLPWLSVLAVSSVAAPVGCWMSLRFGWSAARFLLIGPILQALAAVPVPQMIFLPSLFFPSTVQTQAMLAENIWIDAAVYLLSLGLAAYLLRRTAASLLSKIVLFTALLGGIFLSDLALLQLGSRVGPYWGRFFSVLPVLGFLLALNRRPRNLETAKNIEEILAAYRWSFSGAFGLYLLFCLPIFAVSLAAKGSALGGVFIPILNPLELWQGSVLLAFVLWLKIFLPRGVRTPKLLRWGIPLLLFLWLNQVAARSTWWYLGVSYSSIWDAMRTPHYQGVIAILWGMLGLGAILYGQKTQDRPLWRLGALLLALDMGKLLLVDLNRAATLTRILAFLVLGGLFLLIGWAAPLPPKPQGTRDETAAEQEN